MAVQIGHINCQFSELKPRKENGSASQVLFCPFNYGHRVSFADFALHIEGCEDKDLKKDVIERCRFNEVHFFPANEVDRQTHENECPNRREGVPVLPAAKFGPKKVPGRLVPWRERIGIEDPRIPQPSLPSLRDVLGPSVHFPELEEFMNRGYEAPNMDGHIEYRVNGLNAYEYVLENGLGDYGSYGAFTSQMSPAEKRRFANFLEERALVLERDNLKKEKRKQIAAIMAARTKAREGGR